MTSGSAPVFYLCFHYQTHTLCFFGCWNWILPENSSNWWVFSGSFKCQLGSSGWRVSKLFFSSEKRNVKSSHMITNCQNDLWIRPPCSFPCFLAIRLIRSWYYHKTIWFREFFGSFKGQLGSSGWSLSKLFLSSKKKKSLIIPYHRHLPKWLPDLLLVLSHVFVIKVIRNHVLGVAETEYISKLLDQVSFFHVVQVSTWFWIILIGWSPLKLFLCPKRKKFGIWSQRPLPNNLWIRPLFVWLLKFYPSNLYSHYNIGYWHFLIFMQFFERYLVFHK